MRLSLREGLAQGLQMLVGMRTLRHLALGTLVFTTSACIIDGVVLPEDRADEGADTAPPPPPGANVLRSDLIFYTGTNPVLVVGAPEAAPGLGTVIVRNEARGFTAVTPTHRDGSFNVPVTASAGESLSVAFAYDTGVQSSTDPTSGDANASSATIVLAAPSEVAAQAANDLSTNFGEQDPSMPTGGDNPSARVQSPDNGGVVTVSGDPGTVSWNVGVLVANVSLGATGYSRAADDGSFVVRVEGRSGDELQIFTVEPDASNGGGNAVILVVP